MSEKKTYKDMNIPNTTVKDIFTPLFSAISIDGKKIIYQLDSPCFLTKGIELAVTNDVGYTKAHPKNGTNISKEELMQYLKDSDENIVNNERMVNDAYILNLINCANDLKFYKNLLMNIQGMVKKLNNDFFKKYGKTTTEFYEYLNRKYNLSGTEVEKTKDTKKVNNSKKSLFYRIFH